MKLSEALRLGEFALPPTHNNWFKRDEKDKVCGACAVGRACFAAGYNPSEQNYEMKRLDHFMLKTWPWVAAVSGPFPVHPDRTLLILSWLEYTGRANNVLIAMSNLYEVHGKSLPEIADWVSTIEPQDAVEPEPVDKPVAMYAGVIR